MCFFTSGGSCTEMVRLGPSFSETFFFGAFFGFVLFSSMILSITDAPPSEDSAFDNTPSNWEYGREGRGMLARLSFHTYTSRCHDPKPSRIKVSSRAFSAFDDNLCGKHNVLSHRNQQQLNGHVGMTIFSPPRLFTFPVRAAIWSRIFDS